MFAVEVSDHIMIAHSFRGEVFGPAQALHGATFAVSVAFMAQRLDANGIVVDIGRAFDVLKDILKPINYRNLDDVPAFAGVNTTTEFLTKYIFDRLADAVRAGSLGREPREIAALRVTIGESPSARAWYEAPVWVSLSATFAVPGSLETPTGGYAYDRRVIAELRRLGWAIDVLDLGDGFPSPAAETRARAVATLLAAPGDGPLVIDGLALGVLPDAAEALRSRRPVVALVHHPLAYETGLSAEEAKDFRQIERRALAVVRGVVVTSPTTARLLVTHYAVSQDRIAVALPGVDRAPRAPGSGGDTVHLLAVGALVRRKGYDVLLAALGGLQDLDWRLTIVGATDRDSATAQAIERQIAALGLTGRVTLTGAIDAQTLREHHARADVFVLASRFEGYGMAFTEAIAHGLPVIGTTAGAIPDAVPPEAGILVSPDDAAALAAAVRIIITGQKVRIALADAAWLAAARLPTWRDTGEAVAVALRAVG